MNKNEYRLSLKEVNEHSTELNFAQEKIKTKTIHPYQMILHQPPGIVSSVIKKTGVWEQGITNRFESVFSVQCSTPQYFVDVGTNIGYYSSLAASFGYSVLSIEAMSYNLHLFRETVALNKFDNQIQIKHVGVSDQSGGYLCMHMPTGNAGNGVATFSAVACEKDVTQVPVKTLDEITGFTSTGFTSSGGQGIANNQYKHTVAMKLDIEGFETRAILGGKEFIKHVNPCYIWFEHTPHAVVRSGKGKNEIFDTLHQLGYYLYDIATPSNHIRSLEHDAFIEARHASCQHDYACPIE
jgi:FkbM family methyltransferase